MTDLRGTIFEGREHVFNSDYAETRLKGAIAMLEDAVTVEQTEAALGQLDIVFHEIKTSATNAGLYWR